jgi:thioredoxin-like negative regulator of GroEL
MGILSYGTAIPELEAALGCNPSSYLLRRKLGLYLVRAGRYDEALEHLTACQRVRPRSPDVAFYRAVTMIAAGELERGRPLLARALARLAREAAVALCRSLRWLFGSEAVRQRLRREIAAAGGPVPQRDRSRPSALPFRIVRVETTRAGVTAGRRVRLADEELREAVSRS